MNVLSLFAGIGGLDLGCEQVGWRTAVYSEFDPKIAAKKNGRQYAAEVMAKRFPDAINVGDVSQLAFATNERGVHGILEPTEDYPNGYDTLWVGRIGIIIGGFPCTDISQAGKQAGIEEGTRSGLWRHFFQAIKGLRPRGVIIENVAALAGKGLDRVLRDLASIGYDAEWDVIAAAGVGAPHLRERLFIIAWPTGQGCHGAWGTPPVSDAWLTEPDDVPRLVGDVPNRPARLRCLGNSVVPQVAAHVAKLLRTRIDAGARGYSTPVDVADVRHNRDSDFFAKGASKRLGTAGDIMDWPNKFPRAGRLTRGIAYERVRSCTQAHAKATGLKYMAATLRPRADDHPELPHVGLVPTPNASVANDGEGAKTWVERKLRHAAKAENPTRASMPLSIYVQLKADERLIPTPTATDAESSRRASAIRDKEWTSNPGETLLDYVDPTNGGKLLPTPTTQDAKNNGGASQFERKSPPLNVVAKLLPTPAAADGERASDTYMRGNPTLQGSARLLPTPTASMLTENDMVQAAFRGNDPDRPSYEDATFAKLLPTPCVADANGSRATKGAARPNEGGLQHRARLLPKPRPCSGLRSSGLNRTEIMDALDETVGAKLLPTPTTSEGGARFDGQSREGGGNLTGAAKLLPTPVSGDHRSGMASRHGPGERRANLNDATVGIERREGGRLGPEWVEWVCGVPIGWTDLTKDL